MNKFYLKEHDFLTKGAREGRSSAKKRAHDDDDAEETCAEATPPKRQRSEEETTGENCDSVQCDDTANRRCVFGLLSFVNGCN